jgi:hypothetical protein
MPVGRYGRPRLRRAEACALPGHAGAERLLTMGQLNRPLTYVVTVMAGYLSAYSADVERSGLL